MNPHESGHHSPLTHGDPLLDELPALVEEARQLARRRAVEALSQELTEQLLAAARARLAAPAPAPSAKPAPPPPAPAPPALRTPATEPDPPTAQPAPQPPPAPRDPDRLGIYVYGVTRATARLPEELTGVHREHRPGVIVQGNLAAVVSEVPLSEFGEHELREHLEDLAWVERTARAHEAVVEAVGRQSTLVPMRMCTIYRGREGALEMLMREQGALERALEHLDGKSEWSVKLFSEHPADNEADAGGQADSTDPAAAEDAASGTTYLQARLSEREAREQHRRGLRQVAGEVHEQICRVVADAVISRPQPSELTGHPGEMLLNGVYLVEDEELIHFTDVVTRLHDRYAEQGIELVTTGPWPAYNFVSGTIGAAW